MINDDISSTSFEHEGETIEDVKVERPFLFKVLLHNDDYTPMDYVVEVLQNYFGFEQSDAVEIMLNVHYNGIGVCGVFPKEIAETKVHLVTENARSKSHPLKCTMEKE